MQVFYLWVQKCVYTRPEVRVIEKNTAAEHAYDNKRYIEMTVDKYGKMLFRICFSLVNDYYDAEDALQETFIKLMTKAPRFTDEEHEKAWLIRVATNLCKNMIRFRKNNNRLSLDEITEVGIKEEDSEIFDAIMRLPAKYKIVMDLHYIEGYTAGEIAQITGVNADAVRKRLQTARNKLKTELEN